MSEDFATAIVSFFHKFLGKKLWIVPLALAIGLWSAWFYGKKDWYIFSSAIFFSAIIGLFFITILYSLIALGINKIIQHYKNKNQERTNSLNLEKRRKNKENEHANRVWKLVAHSELDYIKIASYILSLEKHDDNDYVRFFKSPKPFSNEEKMFNAIYGIQNYFNFQGYPLLKIEQTLGGIYITIDPYFYKLLDQFNQREEWKKIEIN